MSEKTATQYWEIWFPQAAATGVLLCRSLIDAAEAVLFHSAPQVITVIVRAADGSPLAKGEDLKSTANSPMCRLERQGEKILRTDLWPTAQDFGSLVLLPGGEAGTLKAWWHAPDHSEWRWSVEFYNKR